MFRILLFGLGSLCTVCSSNNKVASFSASVNTYPDVFNVTPAPVSPSFKTILSFNFKSELTVVVVPCTVKFPGLVVPVAPVSSNSVSFCYSYSIISSVYV